MRKLCSASIASLFVAALAFSGCGSDTGSTATSSTSQDAAVGDTGSKDGTGTGDSASVDTVSGDTGGAIDTPESKDTQPLDVASDTDPGDTTTPGDVAEVTPTDTVGDATTDTKTDAKTDTQVDVIPSKCASDSDCPKGFGDCISGHCDVASGKCQFKLAADGAACTTGGACGGSGICKQGACAFKGACDPVDCAPEPLACGAKVVINPATLGASGTGVWPCTGKTWDGGEKFFALSSDATTTATVNLAADSTENAALLVLGTYTTGSCAPKACSATGVKQVLGLPAGVQQILAVETKAGTSAVLTLTVTCAPKAKCGDGQCTTGELCSSCPKDCGPCAVCGDKTCDPVNENCGSCPGDCGDCPPLAPECATKLSSDPSPTGCGGCSCEACVFAMDPYCQKNAWDSVCVSECSIKCGGPVCGKPAWCGDKACNGKEDQTTCPDDCGDPSNGCGDGQCGIYDTCSSCPGDCGPCTGANSNAAVCGDGTCNGSEHCGVCPADCGVCSADCPNVDKTSSAPGCGGCACEAQVCAQDSFCCKTAWDGMCAAECASVLQVKCPADKCGDGICSGTENCDSCGDDCGACVCGDGVCASSESTDSCPGDCPLGCSSSDTAGCAGCACEADVCANDPFCCKTMWDSACADECVATGLMQCK